MAEEMNGAESLVRTLLAGGVNVCFTNPGTSEMHFVAALDKVPGMRCVLGLGNIDASLDQPSHIRQVHFFLFGVRTLGAEQLQVSGFKVSQEVIRQHPIDATASAGHGCGHERPSSAGRSRPQCHCPA